MKYAEPQQLCFNTGINYNDLENEVKRLEIDHHSRLIPLTQVRL